MNIPSARGGPSFGAHAFIWAGEWSHEGAERVISGAASAGLDFVEIPLLDPVTMDVEHTRALLDRYGIGCSCSLGLPKESHLPFDPDGAERFLAGTVELTAALGSSVLTGCLYTHLGTLTGRPPEPEELRASPASSRARPGAPPKGAPSSASRRPTATRPTSSNSPRRRRSCSTRSTSPTSSRTWTPTT